MDVPELIVGVTSRLEVIKEAQSGPAQALAIIVLEVYLDDTAKRVPQKIKAKQRPEAPDVLDPYNYGPC